MLEIQKNSEVMSKVAEIVKQNAEISLKIEEQKEECNKLQEENLKLIIRENIRKLYKIESENYDLLEEILVINNYKFLCRILSSFNVFINEKTKEIILLKNDETLIYFVNKEKSKKILIVNDFNLDDVLPRVFQNLENEKDAKAFVIYYKSGEVEIENLKLISNYIYN